MGLCNRYWAICCPGPSLARRETVTDMLKTNPDKIVAVNGAILCSPAIWFDWWSVQDIEVFRSVIQANSAGPRSLTAPLSIEPPRLWFPDRWSGDIPSDHEDLLHIFNCMEKESFPSDRVDQFGQMMPFGRHINWREFTMITAIGLAVLKGASLIRIFGADLAGKGYCLEGLENERTIHNDKRWATEIARLDEVTREAEKYGVNIFREAV